MKQSHFDNIAQITVGVDASRSPDNSTTKKDLYSKTLSEIAAEGKAKAIALMRRGLLEALGKQNHVVMQFQEFRTFMPVAFPLRPCTPDRLQEAARAEQLTVAVASDGRGGETFTIFRQAKSVATALAASEKNGAWERHLRIMRANAEDAKNRAKQAAQEKPAPFDPEKVAIQARRIARLGDVPVGYAVTILQAIANKAAARNPDMVAVLMRVHMNEQRALGVEVTSQDALAHVNGMLKQ